MKNAVIAIAATIAALAIPGSAAALTPVSPVGGIPSTTHPLLTWTLDGDEPSIVQISKASETTPDGKFFDEDQAAEGFLDDSATSWQPTTGLVAGTYWWNVSWNAPDFSTSGYTAPAEFVIPATLTSMSVRRGLVLHYSHETDFNVAWTSDTATVNASLAIYVGTKRVAYLHDLGDDGSSHEFAWTERKPYRGVKVKLVATVTAGTISRSKSLVTKSA